MPREENKELEEERKARTAYDLIRIRLTRLEKNIEKPAPLPARREPPKPKPPVEFVRNVVGSSAAAGSAEFHIFRNNRRKEQERVAYIEREGLRKDLDEEFEKRRQERREMEEKRTAKKRKKRQRRKDRIKHGKKSKNGNDSGSSDSESDDDAASETDDKTEQNVDKSSLAEENLSATENTDLDIRT